jgi:endo-1,4-beta-xylanase
MVKLSLFGAGLLLSGAIAAPAEQVRAYGPEPEGNSLEARQGGYYFQNWSEGGSNIRCVNGAGGLYTATWNSKGGFVCGKGWRGGGARCVHD